MPGSMKLKFTRYLMRIANIVLHDWVPTAAMPSKPGKWVVQKTSSRSKFSRKKTRTMALQLQAASPDLKSLQHQLDSNPDDVEPLMPFVLNIDKFPVHEQTTARNLLRSRFFDDNGTGTYKIKEAFQLLTAKNLSRVIFKLADKQMEQHVFVNFNQKYLSHFPISDLYILLSRHPLDPFAMFVFDQFRGKFLEQPLSTRLQYFELISAKVCVDILKSKNIGRMLSNDELILITSKLKEYEMAKRNTMLPANDTLFKDCSELIGQIIKVVIQNVNRLTTGNLQSILDHDLIPSLRESKMIIHELLKRQNQSVSVIPNFGAIEPDKLIGILSTDNFASFHSMMAPKMDHHHSNSHNQNSPNRGGHAHLVLEGPVVMMVRDKSRKHSNNTTVIDYNISVQIQNLNKLFDSNLGRDRRGNIYVVLLQRIPKDHEVVLSASNTYGDGKLKEIGLTLSVINPVAVIQWPLPQIEKAATFRIHAQLRPSQALPQPVNQGMKDLLNGSGLSEDQKSVDLPQLNGRQQVAMMIFNGQRPNGNYNTDRLSWVNVQFSMTMTFGEMVDCACAQLGLDPPINSGHNGNNNNNDYGFGNWAIVNNGNAKGIRYVVRNQMGHRCDDKEIVAKYWQKMMKDHHSNLFPVFVFSQMSQNNGQGQGQQQNPFNFGFGM